MVLRVGDIVELFSWASKYHVVNITKTEIICVMHINDKLEKYTFNKERFELHDWKPAKLKWY